MSDSALRVPDGLARRTDPTTSHEAANYVDRAGSRVEVLRLLAVYGPMCDDEVLMRHDGDDKRYLGKHYTGSRLRTARKELERWELVEATFLPATTRSGKRADEWSITDTGREFLSEVAL